MMTRTLVLYQPAPNTVKTAMSGIPGPCWDDVGNVLGRRAGTPKVILPGDVRLMMGFTLDRMGAFVAAAMGKDQPYHRSTVWHWEHSTSRHQLMPRAVADAYRQIIRECVRVASGGKYAAQVANLRLWRVTLRRVA